jgi:uncharacterized protein involved in exopolysaccharide biosynthesis/Mrp family chromosome partitioning ATPase
MNTSLKHVPMGLSHSPQSMALAKAAEGGLGADRLMLLPDVGVKPEPLARDVTVIRLREVIGYQTRFWKPGVIAGALAAVAVFVVLGCGTKVYEGVSTLVVRIQETSLTDIEHKGGGLTEQSAMQIVNNHRTTMEARRFVDFVYSRAEPSDMVAYLDGADKTGLRSRLMVALHLKDPPKVLSPQDYFAKKMTQVRQVEPVKDSHMITVTIKDSDPAVAAKFANLYVQSYLEFQENEAARTASSAQSRLADQVDEVRRRLDTKEAELAEFSQQTDLLKSGDTAGDMSVLMVQEMGKASAGIDVELLRAQQRLQQLQAGLSPQVDVSGVKGLGDDQQIIEIQKMLIAARSRRDALLEYCGSQHPKLLQCESEVGRLEQEARSRIQAIITAAKSEEQRLISEKQDFAQKLAEARKVAFEQGGNRTRQKQLSDEVEGLRTLQSSLVKQQEVARMAFEVRNSTNLEVVDLALPPESAVWPSKSLALLASMLVFGVLGLGLPMGIGLTRDHLVPLIKPLASETSTSLAITPVHQEFAAAPAMRPWTPPPAPARVEPRPAPVELKMPPTVAMMPRLDYREGPLQLNELIHRPADRGGNAMAPAIAHLEQQRMIRGGTGVLLVTSAHSAEGKSLCASAMAAAFCQAGRSAFLIECNPVAPAVHQRFPGPGSHSAWIEQIEPLRYGQSNLFLLSADQLPAHDVATLAVGYRTWVEKARAQGVDWVILDAAPLLHGCADVLPLAPLATDILLVHDEARADARHVKAALVLLQRIAPPAVLRGIVANQPW